MNEHYAPLQLTNTNASPRLNPNGIIFMAETGGSSEVAYSPETLTASNETVGLQSRLLLGADALNPTKIDMEQVTKEDLETGAGAIQEIEQGSLAERNAAYESDDFAENKRTWAEQVTKRFSEHKSFWEGTKGKAWTESFKKIGIDPTNLNPDALYDEYFSPGETPSTQRFTEKVLASYAKADGNLDYDRLVADKEGLTWIAGMFGANSSEIIVELIQAKANLKTKPDAFVQAANTAQNNTIRLNDLTKREKHLLTFLHDPKNYIQQHSVRQTAQPTLAPEQTDTHDDERKDDVEPIHYSDETPIQRPTETVKEPIIPTPTSVVEQQAAQERNRIAQQATRLINYETGEITNERVDLSQSFPELVTVTQEVLEHGQTNLRNGTIIFSDVARAMIDKLAQEANNKNLELSFVLQGQWVNRNNKEVFVVAYPVPAMD